MGCSCSKCNKCSCSCSDSCEEPAVVIASALEVTNSWNVPACDEEALLYIPGLTTALIGSYITNPTYGTFRVTGINASGGKLKIINDCFVGNATPGTVVPADTTFVFTGSPTLTSYEDWTPVGTAGGAMTVTVDTVNTANWFAVDDTVWFELSLDITLGGTPHPALYFSLPVEGEPKDLQKHALVEVTTGVDPGAFWRVDLVTPEKMLVGLEGFANWPAGTATVNISGFYQRAQ